MRRWLFHVVSLFSLLLAVAAGVMWVRSYSRVEMVQHKAYELREAPRPHTLTTTLGARSSLGGTQFHYSTAVHSFGMVEQARSDPIYWNVGLRWLVFTEGRFSYPIQGDAHPKRTQWTLGSFQFNKSQWGGSDIPNTKISVTLPYWSIVLSGMVLPIARMFRVLSYRRRLRAGLCLHCGYDLRASVDRCPECGEPIHQLIVKKIPRDDPREGMLESSHNTFGSKRCKKRSNL